ncbi:MAG: hypothetical protein WD556_13580 [Actinomycetota bacterium]
MPREGISARGRRLLVEGRLNVLKVDREAIRATCKGESGTVHQLSWTSAADWFCSCPARSRCAHLVALMLVTIEPGGTWTSAADVISRHEDPFEGVAQ